jgi:predicted amidohydrolase
MATTLYDWHTWSPRGEIAPRFWTENAGGSEGDAVLVTACDTAISWGAWRRIEPIQGGCTYRFAALYHAQGVAHPLRCISARLEWQDQSGQPLQPPDYAWPHGKENGWTRLEYITTVPAAARRVLVDLAFGWSLGGEVRWDSAIELCEEVHAPNRVVRAMTVYKRPASTRDAAHSVECFCQCIDKATTQHPDLICLPEGITLIGTGQSYEDVCEPLHGPTLQRLSTVARRLGCYIVAGIYERSGTAIYNTALLVGRNGKLVGSYRKTHLPREEFEGGLVAGDCYPIFETDFGKVGILICWDLQFPEVARALALRGAEVLLLPIWGGSEALAYARAIENHVFLISSSYDMRSFILDPTGVVLTEATPESPLAIAEIHLDRKFVQPWIGDMKNRTWKERRPDIVIDPSPP